MKKLITVIVTLIILLPVGYQDASALSCLYQNPEDRFKSADLVMTAEALEIVDSFNGKHTWKLKIVEMLSNPQNLFMDIDYVTDAPWDGTTSPATRMEAGETYLLHVNEGEVGACNYPETLSNLTQDQQEVLTKARTAFPLSFSDVSKDHSHYTFIEWAKANGVVTGHPDGTFKPDSTINRAEFTVIILRYYARFIGPMESPTCNDIQQNNSNIYPDVSWSDWHWFSACFATRSGWIHGYPDGTFGPEKNINFAEMSKITTKALVKNFNEGVNSPWYKQYTDELYSRNAVPDSITSIDQLITRGEMVEIIWRLAEGF